MASDIVRGGRVAAWRRPPESVGVVGLLLAALAAIAAAPALLPQSYSWIEHGVSESAAQGVEGAWLARLGLLGYGLAVLWLVPLRRAAWGRLAAAAHRGFGLSMLGVAAFSAKPWWADPVYVASEEFLHSVFSGTAGFAFIAGLTALVVRRWHRSIPAALPDWVALLVAVAVPLASASGVWGLLQRLMFLTAAAWYAREAWNARHPAPPDPLR